MSMALAAVSPMELAVLPQEASYVPHTPEQMLNAPHTKEALVHAKEPLLMLRPLRPVSLRTVEMLHPVQILMLDAPLFKLDASPLDMVVSAV